MAKFTFGFKNVNGSAFDIRVVDAIDGQWPSDRAVRGLRSFIVDEMNRAGRQAVLIAKTPGHSPYLTGALVKSIKWIKAEKGAISSRVLTGALSVGVPYGRRQEFENATRPRYLERALEQAFPDFIQAIQDRGAIEDIIFGRRRMEGGGQRF